MTVGDLLDRQRVVVAAVDGFFEDRRVRRHAAETVLVYETFELAAGDQAAPDEVEPYRLAVLLESSDRVRDRCGIGRGMGHVDAPFMPLSCSNAAYRRSENDVR